MLPSMRRATTAEPYRCSFCGKEQAKVKKLFSSPSELAQAFICNQCVRVCQMILDGDTEAIEAHNRRQSVWWRKLLRKIGRPFAAENV